MQQICQEYASEFNMNMGYDINVEFADCHWGLVTSSSNAPKAPELNEWVVYETHLEGRFTKWTNNYGYVSREAKDCMLAFFMHWT